MTVMRRHKPNGTFGVALTWRAPATYLKSVIMMGVFRVFVLGPAAWSPATGTVPEPMTMDAIGNSAVMVAAPGLYRTGSDRPDLAFDAVIGVEALTAGRSVFSRHAPNSDDASAAGSAAPDSGCHRKSVTSNTMTPRPRLIETQVRICARAAPPAPHSDAATARSSLL